MCNRRGKNIIAIGLLSGAVDSTIFICWAKQILLPALTEKAVIVMDNATFHKGVRDMQKIKQMLGILCFPYSPDLNPIEKKWAQAKQIRRTLLFANHLT